MLPRWLLRRAARRAMTGREAAGLLTAFGDLAYLVARDRSLSCRVRNDHPGERFWAGVAVEIAARTGREIGVRTADRYEQARGPLSLFRRSRREA